MGRPGTRSATIAARSPAACGCGKLTAETRPPITPANSPLVNKLSWSTFAGISPATVEPPALGRFLILSMLVHFLFNGFNMIIAGLAMLQESV